MHVLRAKKLTFLVEPEKGYYEKEYRFFFTEWKKKQDSQKMNMGTHRIVI